MSAFSRPMANWVDGFSFQLDADCARTDGNTYIIAQLYTIGWTEKQRWTYFEARTCLTPEIRKDASLGVHMHLEPDEDDVPYTLALDGGHVQLVHLVYLVRIRNVETVASTKTPYVWTILATACQVIHSQMLRGFVSILSVGVK